MRLVTYTIDGEEYLVRVETPKKKGEAVCIEGAVIPPRYEEISFSARILPEERNFSLNIATHTDFEQIMADVTQKSIVKACAQEFQVYLIDHNQYNPDDWRKERQ